MPLYEYLCYDCRTRFDELRPMTNADDPVVCPDCNGHDTMRALSTFFSNSAENNTGGAPMMPVNGGGGCCGGMCACGGHSPN